MKPDTQVQRTLTRLQQLIRRPTVEGGQAVLSHALPLRLTNRTVQGVSLLEDEAKAFMAVLLALDGDLRFEHLSNIEETAWEFVGDCWADRTTDHIPAFLDLHARDVFERVCFLPIEHLLVASVEDAVGIRLLPLNDPSLPQLPPSPRFSTAPPVGSFAASRVSGTHHGLMADRAQAIAGHALRVMRVALRRHQGINDKQLRFRLADWYVFDDGLFGWRTRGDVAYNLEFNHELVQLIEAQPAAQMKLDPKTDAMKKADLALRWIERSALDGEPLPALLFLFFALEALLGSKSEDKKAHLLAFRKTMLGHAVNGAFTHPHRSWLLYDQVRSYAVHGEDILKVDWDLVQSFAAEVRSTLEQYLTVCKAQDFGRRKRLLKYLDTHPDRPQLIAWLRENGGKSWPPYLDGLKGIETLDDPPLPAERDEE